MAIERIEHGYGQKHRSLWCGKETCPRLLEQCRSSELFSCKLECWDARGHDPDGLVVVVFRRRHGSQPELTAGLGTTAADVSALLHHPEGGLPRFQGQTEDC